MAMPSTLALLAQDNLLLPPYISQIESLLATLPESISELGLSESQLLLARLDLLFLEHSIVHSGGVPPARLSGIVTEIAHMTARPAGITYEDLIFSNPATDLRHFTVAQVGEAEQDFYLGHQYIEGELSLAITTAFQLSQSGHLSDNSETDLRLIATCLEKSATYMSAFGQRLPRASFQSFARYHDKNPFRPETKSAGGQFSSSIPTLDILLAGEQVPAQVVAYWLNILNFFPVYGQAEFLMALQLSKSGNSIRELIQVTQNQAAIVAFEEIDQQIRAFRGKHYNAVSTHLPDELHTGDELKNFLKERIHISHT
jgi:hypothetical protein